MTRDHGVIHDLRVALRILADGARRDPVSGLVMPLVGAAALFVLWYRAWLPWSVIRVIICHDLC